MRVATMHHSILHYYHWMVIRILAACLIKRNRPPFSRSSFFCSFFVLNYWTKGTYIYIYTTYNWADQNYFRISFWTMPMWLKSVTLMRSVITIDGIFIFCIDNRENDHHRAKAHTHTNEKEQSIMRLHEFRSFLFPFSFPCHFPHTLKN